MPKELDELHSKIHSELHGKTNPKTNKPYSDDDIWAIAQTQFKKMNEKKEVLYSDYEKIEIKEEGGEFYSYGYVATTHPDRAKNGRYAGDVLTKNAVGSIVEQINSRKGMMADLASYRHDWVKENDPGMPVVGRAVEAELRQLPDGNYGAWVKTHHNKAHPKFDNIKYEVEKGYLPGYSIEYEAKKTADTSVDGQSFRMIDQLDIYGFGFANGRAIANPQAIIEGTLVKEISTQTISEGCNMEQTQVKEIVPETVQIDAKEYDAYKKFQELQLKEKKTEELKIVVKEVLAGLVPEQKVKMDGRMETKEAAIELKEWKEINDDKVSVKEAFSRATALANKCGATERWYAQGFGSSSFKPVEFKTAGAYGEKIEVKAALQLTTNQSTDTDYLQSAAELSDIYAPAVAKMLNQKTTYFGLVPKVEYSGREAITWRAENVANTSASSYAEGAAITKGNTTRQKLREEFKYYKVGVQVTGQMIESSKSGIGDVFAAEVEAATRRLLALMNADLFGTNGTFTDLGFLGLEYIATSTTYTTLYGLTRSTTNLLGASNSEFAAQSSAPISKPTLRTAVRTLEVNGADRSGLVFVCHPLQRDMILALLDDAQRFMSTSARVGFEGLPSFDGVPIYADKDANNDDIFLVNLGENGVRLGVQVPVRFEDLAKTDDSRSGFLKFYGNQYAIAPKQAVYMIQGLATS